MNKVARYICIGVLLFVFLSCSAFPSGRVEQTRGKREIRAYWILDGDMSPESAEMYLERYLFPTSLATLFWTSFSLVGTEIRLDTTAGYRIVRRQRVMDESIGSFAVHGYDLLVEVSREAGGPGSPRSVETYEVRFSYPETPSGAGGATGVFPQPLEKSVLDGIREDGRTSGKARVDRIEYLGSGRFRATVQIGD
jgi:hypothetical protein